MISSCLSLMIALSLHVGLEGDYNSIHPHARCTVDNTIVGVYYNSEESISTYIGYKFKSPFDTEIEVGLVTGYSSAPVVPLLRITKDNWFITPAYEISPSKTMGITIGYEFKF